MTKGQFDDLLRQGHTPDEILKMYPRSARAFFVEYPELKKMYYYAGEERND